MIDVKLTEKASVVLAIVFAVIVVLAVAAAGIITYERQEPLVIAGKEFGFGTGELRKKTADLVSTKQELLEALKKVAELQSENRQLREMVRTLTEREQKAASEASALWFPVADVTFYTDGRYTTDAGKEGRGKWEDRDSELSLKLISWTSTEIVLGTNLPAPGNKIRISYKRSILVPMEKWKYQVMLTETHSDNVEVRIERRPQT